MEEVMTRLMLLCAWLCAMAFVVGADPAQAVGGNNFSYVSNTGSDGHGCSNPTTDACATLNRALDTTANYGEVDCVNAGDYSVSLTITQSVTIDCAGGVAATNGTITITGANIVVRLRNLSINNQGNGSYGISANLLSALYIENCVITNFNNAVTSTTPYVGIQFQSTQDALLFVTNSIIDNNGSPSGVTGGIYIKPGSATEAIVSIDHSQINGNAFGIVGDGTSGGMIRATISDSVVSGNTDDGIAATSSGETVWFLVDQTKVAGNTYGLAAGGSGTEILARNSSVFGNAYGLHTSGGGTLYSYGNNSVNGNSTNGAFTGTIGLQ
jgi:hypothetical protein